MSFSLSLIARSCLFAALAPGLALAAEAQPDFSGIWQLASRPMTSAQGYPDVPLTPAGRALVDAHRALVDPVGENPTLFCVTHGMPEMMMGGGGYPLEIIHKDDQVTMISEWMSETRRVYLGERIRPTDDMFPSRHGYSAGHWEGATLVVETTKLQDMVDSRFPHSASTTIVERFSLTRDTDGTKRLIADTEVRDPLWLSEPLQYRLEWTPYALGWIQPYECMEETWFERLEELEEQATDAPKAARAARAETPVTQGLYNWIHTTGNADLAFPFYRDIFGFELEHSTFATVSANTPPPAIRSRDEAGSDSLIWQLTDSDGSRYRTVFMGTPGIGFGLELSEFLDIPREERHANPWDPGNSILLLEVSDFNEVLRRLDAAGAPVVTAGGRPLRFAANAAILVRDPDGYLVLVTASTDAGPNGDTGMVTDIDVGLSVANTDDSLAFYRDLMQFEIGTTRELPNADLALFGLDAGRLLQTTTRIPNTGVDVLLWEFDVPDAVAVQPLVWRIQDVGAPQFQLQVRDLDDLLQRTRAAGYGFLSVNGAPIQRPFGRFVFAKDPDGVLVEYVEPAAP